jgi:hypothetical protein
MQCRRTEPSVLFEVVPPVRYWELASMTYFRFRSTWHKLWGLCIINVPVVSTLINQERNRLCRDFYHFPKLCYLVSGEISENSADKCFIGPVFLPNRESWRCCSVCRPLVFGSTRAWFRFHLRAAATVKCTREAVVRIVTRLRAGCPWFVSRQGQAFYLSFKTSRSTLKPTKPPV